MQRIYCSNCGHMVQHKANFCPYCGASQHGSAAATYSHAPAAPQPIQPAPDQSAGAPLAPETIVPIPSKKVPKKHLSSIAVLAFILNYIVKSSIILLLAAVTILIAPFLSLVILGVYFTGIVLVAILAHNNFFYEVDETSFKKHYGILHKQTVTIPFEQIQNVNISRSLIEQLLGLASIDIETAGNSDTAKKSVVGNLNTTAEGLLPGVSLEEARVLHDLLLQKAAETQ